MTEGGSPPRTTAASGGLCSRCIILLIVLGFAALFIWLFVRPDEPKCYIGAFYVPALNKTLNENSNSAILFNVEFNNKNRDFGIRYNDVNVTVGVFLDRNRTSMIGSSTIPGFYQRHRKRLKKSTNLKWSSVERHAGELNQTVRVDEKTYFRVNFTTTVRYKFLMIYTSRYRLWGGANVAVDDAGLKVEKDSIRLGHSLPVIMSDATTLASGCYGMLPAVLGLLVSILYF